MTGEAWIGVVALVVVLALWYWRSRND